MLDLLLSFIPGGGLTAIGALIAAVLTAIGGAWLKGRSSGKQSERDKQARAKVKSLEDQLEMDREATEAERRATGMTDAEAKAEAMKWAKH